MSNLTLAEKMKTKNLQKSSQHEYQYLQLSFFLFRTYSSYKCILVKIPITFSSSQILLTVPAPINQKKRNIFEVTLNEPRAKKGRKRHELKQPLPIPIETLTGVKADDSLWRFYKGKYLSKTQNRFFLV